MQHRNALTFAKSFFEPFSVDMSEDVIRLPVEVSEGQFAEQLISETGDITCQQDQIQLPHSGQCSPYECCHKHKLTVVLYSAQYAAHTGYS